MNISTSSSRLSNLRECILETGYLFYRSRVIHVAFEFGIFKTIGRNTFSARELARKLKVSFRGISIFLDALVSLRLLGKKNGFFKNKRETLEICFPGKEGYLGDIVKLQGTSWAGWQNLAEIVRTGKPFRPPPFLEKDSAAVRDFIFAMHNTAVGHAEELARKVSLRKRYHLLDLGGGSGAFTAYFLKANPGLRGTIFDLPQTLRVTREILKRYKLDGRVTFQNGDFLKNPVRGNHDVVFLSHIIHGLSEKDNRKLMEKIFAVLPKGGELLIQDFFLNDHQTSPEFPALFALNMLIHTPEGRCYAFSEAEQWMKEAGFSKVSRLPFRFPRSIRILRGIK